MRALVLRSLGAATLCVLLVGMLSCARDQQLVSVRVQPDTEDFGTPDPALNVQLRALGTFIHPPVTKDITNQVTWVSNTPDVASVTSTGLLSPGGLACGNAQVSATVQTNSSAGNRTSKGAIITGFMTANVACPGQGGGGGSVLTLTVDNNGTGSGTVNSSSGGSCSAYPCKLIVTSGNTINLTAVAASGSTFVTWAGCDSVSGATNEVCTVNNISSNRTVTVTFN
jgi:hypothetical protein